MSSPRSTRTLILGAGISGLSTALALSEQSDEDYAIYEQGTAAGGLCQSFEKTGFWLEKVTHVLHFRSAETQAVVEKLLQGEIDAIERSAWIYFSERYVPYPFQTHLGFLPLAQKVSCMAQFWTPWITNKFNGTRKAQNFEEWIKAQFGRGIAQYFMIPYNTKLWGTAPSEMSTDWVNQFVPGPSMRRVVAGFFLKRDKEVGYNSFFLYPRSRGIRSLVDAFVTRIRPVTFNKKAVRIDLLGKTVSFHDGEVVRYDRLVTTMPLTAFLLQADGVPNELRRAAEKLRATSLMNISYCLRKPLPNSYHWVYFPQARFPFFRLVFPSNISPSLAPQGSSIISAEISNPDKEREGELEDRVKELLLELGMFASPSDVVQTEKTYLEYAYPVHDINREQVVSKSLEFLKSKDVWSIGRFGSWHYSSLGDAISQAYDTVREFELRSISRYPSR